jgi:hypothetical protein
MKYWRIVIAGVAVTVFSTVVAGITCGWLFNWVYEIEPTNIWRQMDAPPPIYYILAVVMNIVLAFVYALLAKGIPGKNKLIKGLVFGLCVWAVGILPGMLANYVFMTIALTVAIYWIISGLVFTPLMGLIIAAIYGE